MWKSSSPSRVTCVKAAGKTSGEFVVKPSRQKNHVKYGTGRAWLPTFICKISVNGQHISFPNWEWEFKSPILLQKGEIFLNTETKSQTVGKYKVDVADETNQAIRFVKSNPCCICSCENFCPIKYKGTCKIWINLKSALFAVEEVNEWWEKGK